MTPGAMLFMAASWTLVLGLVAWSYRRVLRATDARRTGSNGDGAAPPP